MARRRKVSNMLALVVLATLVERPMHPYELASLLRERGKEDSTKINWGSLYTVVQNLEKHGYISAAGTSRQGRRPERTVYALTDAGREELEDWLRELVSVPEREYPRFETALSVIGVLPPDEVMGLLEQRARALEIDLTAQRATLEHVRKDVPRIFLIETEFQLALREAEVAWVRSLLDELRNGTIPGVAEWRRWHETGELPDLADRGLLG